MPPLNLMKRVKKKPRFPRLRCPGTKVFEEKKEKRIKRPTREEMETLQNEEK